MVDAVHELLLSPRAPYKLEARRIRVEEALQVVGNPYTLIRNYRQRNPKIHPLRRRKMLIGRTLTLVIEETIDPTTWLVVTGWESTKRERKMLDRQA